MIPWNASAAQAPPSSTHVYLCGFLEPDSALVLEFRSVADFSSLEAAALINFGSYGSTPQVIRWR